ncbi:polysaccharide export protein [Verrucomicrobia bacterium]|mgnify:FL=1|jgi:protein involved in polysaccharide export with SLBB domain|nr:polysaccharide export protein [Verrucomicrobiota bacterium]MDA7680184.1 polysaccharide export protein [bacterium]MDB4798734.1 polysaccharide export protein [Verrucomicrobiota bacterium]
MRTLRLIVYLTWLSLAGGTTSHAATSNYKIQAEDMLKIVVFNEPTLDLQTRVHGAGTINYPLLDDIEVAGKTAEEVQNLIKSLLEKDYLVKASVNVNILEYSEKTFSVMGEVRVPGTHPLPPEKDIGIVDAISFAGGFTPNANKRRIEFVRDGKKTKYNYDDLLAPKKKDPKLRIVVRQGDVINVLERFF